MLSRASRRVGLFVVFLVSAIPGFGQVNSNHYALILKDAPVTARFVGRDAVRSAAAETYRQRLQRAHLAVRQEAAARAIPVTGSADVVMNAVFVTAAPDRVAELRNFPGVLAVIPMRV